MSENVPFNTSKLLVVVTSLPSAETVKVIARALVEQNFAACVQLTEGIQSIYRWEGKICEEQEVLFAAKTTEPKWFEILAFTPEQYERQYGVWVESEINSKS